MMTTNPTTNQDDAELVAALRAALDRGDSAALRTALDRDDGPELFERLVDRVADRAVADGNLDVAVRTIESPFGPLLVAVTPLGVVRVAFAREDHDLVLGDLARRVSPRILETARRTDAVARELAEYFDGRRRRFDLAVDLRLVGGFRRRVVEALGRIPYGTTATYGALAATLDNPRAVRAVGSACAHNPVPVIVPCHRVVRSDGTIGNYLGGTDAKRALLDLESAA
jgi:methylated-DNA-[protein]-cysteine S-methyltransferase